MRDQTLMAFASQLAVALYERMPRCEVKLCGWTSIRVTTDCDGHAVAQLVQLAPLYELGVDGAVEKVVALTDELERRRRHTG